MKLLRYVENSITKPGILDENGEIHDASRLVSDFVGNTPFVQLSEKIYAKLESVNPGGSIKIDQ